MKLLILLAIFSFAACAVNREHYDEWKHQVAKYNRKFLNGEQARASYESFAIAAKFVKEHNERFRSGKETFQVELNHMSDLVCTNKIIFFI